jgi:cell division protein FtsB
MVNYLALLVAFTVSGVSAYYSIIGLTAIFSAAFYPIVIMGVALELGKLVTTSWLYRNWKSAPLFLKTYLTIAVLVLMLISSMGVFGFLSKAHIEQQLNINTGQADQLEIIQSKLTSEKEEIADLDKQIAQIDAAVTKMTDRGQAASSLHAADQQRKNRDSLVKRKEDHNKTIADLTTERVKLQSSIKKLEAEVGPIKYIAAMVYDSSDEDQLERAVRGVIILLVFVFDPLAVVLLLAANHGLATNRLTNYKRNDILTIEDDVLGEDNVT